VESDQEKPGVIPDYDGEGNVVGLEILNASKRMPNPMSVEYAVTAPLRRPARRCPIGSSASSNGHVA
jgi:hypothetical protein